MKECSFSGDSETDRIRDIVMPYIQDMQHGLDIGYGGDPIKLSAITLDVPILNRLPWWGHVGDFPQHLQGDARDLYWFKDEVLDYVFSSSCLEDFPITETESVLREWLRVLRKDGLIILYIPDEIVFGRYCQETGQPYNENHKNHDMNLLWMLDFLRTRFPNLTIIHTVDIGNSNPYMFLVIGRK